MHKGVVDVEEQFRLKTGLFGYTKESVSEYIANLKSEFKKNSSETEFRLFAVQEELVRLKSDQRGAAPAAIDLQSRQLAEENERLQTEVKDLRSELDRLRVQLAEAE